MSESDSFEAGAPLLERQSASPEPSSTSKRKRDAADSKAASKKRKKTKKPKDIDDSALDVEAGINHAIAQMDSRLMADHVAQRTKRFQPKLSSVEVEDLHIPEKAIKDTTAFEKPRSTDDLPEFLETFATPRRAKKKGPKLSDSPAEKGAPHTLVVAGAGLRAADVTRALRKFQTKDSMVAKLFAKHIKLHEAVHMVKNTRMGIGVGTPQRIIDLLEDGALNTGHLERILVDASHIDQKKRGILDMQEIQTPLVKLLTRPDLKDRYESAARTVELLFY